MYKNICHFCGKEFTTDYVNKKYCSKECRYNSIAKIKNRPNRDELYKLLLSNSFEEVRRMYGLQKVETIQNWCKARNIPDKAQYYYNLKNKFKLDPFKLSTTATDEYTETVDYEYAPVIRINSNHLVIEYKNIYDAAEHVFKYKQSKSCRRVIIIGIKNAVIYDKPYLNSKWIIPPITELLQSVRKEKDR